MNPTVQFFFVLLMSTALIAGFLIIKGLDKPSQISHNPPIINNLGKCDVTGLYCAPASRSN